MIKIWFYYILCILSTKYEFIIYGVFWVQNMSLLYFVYSEYKIWVYYIWCILSTKYEFIIIGVFWVQNMSYYIWCILSTKYELLYMVYSEYKIWVIIYGVFWVRNKSLLYMVNSEFIFLSYFVIFLFIFLPALDKIMNKLI